MGKKTAIVKMEEQYIRISIIYDDKNERGYISGKIGEAEQELKLFPDVLHKDTSRTSSSFSIEFGGCEHTGSREPGRFIKLLLEKLDIKECENC
ncbi:MAG: hypothetical protein DRG11_00380 [Epsilonproteobacteria bacterium]|nr:MAG: hypothetical protein B1H07_03610 [Campylobacteraceae bacterium 4484_166]RLA75691.1 MAG: hypothetical protein DRG11_00380 [Campylobacterota bacterium]